MIPLLSSFYFGSVEHYRLLARHDRVIIDIGEHYERQSYRTRTSIVGPNGTNDLVVQIERRSGEKMPMHSVRLSYDETWPQQHLHAIRSAYGQTPWFIHYIDEIEAVLLKKYDRLVDLNMATIALGLKWLGLTSMPFVSTHYVERDECRITEAGCGPVDPSTPMDARRPLMDLRSTFHPKRSLPPEVPAVATYAQVFADRHGFIPRRSIIDLVCNCGPDAERIIRA
ncbi:MAG: WbqC family protein [Flavobacteriales bacterium]|nr:WbqC family protein [Flavobacteriales bacterium]MCC6939946.1 WbqC family protein [Flavobacteriales bacterium]